MRSMGWVSSQQLEIFVYVLVCVCPHENKHSVQLLMMTDTITRCAWVARKLDIATSGPCGILSQTMSDGCRTM